MAPPAWLQPKRGRPSHRQLRQATRDRVVELIRENYTDFGPTFATEKLVEVHGLRVGVETVRLWMIDAGIWLPREPPRAAGLPASRAPRAASVNSARSTVAGTPGSRTVAPPATLLDYIVHEDTVKERRLRGQQVIVQEKCEAILVK